MLVEVVALQVFYALNQRLAGHEHGPATKIFQLHFLGYLFAYFKVGSIFWASASGILSKSQISSELSSTISRLRQISRSPLSTFRMTSKFSSVVVFLPDHRAEHVLQDAHHRGTVDVLRPGELGKRFNQTLLFINADFADLKRLRRCEKQAAVTI